MQYYVLKDTVISCPQTDPSGSEKYVAVLTPAEWQSRKALFDMGIELEPDTCDIHSTKAEVNYDSLTGSFKIPDRNDLTANSFKFAFALDEKGIVFIDESGLVEKMMEVISRTKRWHEPSLERFLYDFLEQIVSRDLSIMERYEDELNDIEDMILSEKEYTDLSRVNEIRSAVRELRVHYEQLIDMTQEFEENENGFFSEKNLRYIHLFMNRMARLHDAAASLRDHTMQVRDLYHERLEVRQNHTMTLLTVVTTIFMPLTLIAGWYGMNFRYMPELEFRASYPIVIAISVAIAVFSLVFFKKKKWL